MELADVRAKSQKKTKEFPQKCILSPQGILLRDSRFAKPYSICLQTSKELGCIKIVRGWEHWFDGWKTDTCQIHLASINNDELKDLRNEGLAFLHFPSVLCVAVATFMSKKKSTTYDVGILALYNVISKSAVLKIHKTPGKIYRLKCKGSIDNRDRLCVTSYSKQPDRMVKMKQVFSGNFVEEIAATVVAQWTKVEVS